MPPAGSSIQWSRSSMALLCKTGRAAQGDGLQVEKPQVICRPSKHPEASTNKEELDPMLLAWCAQMLEQMLEQGCYEPEDQPWRERGRMLQWRQLTWMTRAGLLASDRTPGLHFNPIPLVRLSSLNTVSWKLKQTKKQTVFDRELSSIDLVSTMQKINYKSGTFPDYLPKPTHLQISPYFYTLQPVLELQNSFSCAV